jgi:hypothetical protein
MSHIEKIDTNSYVTVQGHYAVVNEGSGYAIIDTLTKRIIARNISSFLDCVKTLEHLLGSTEAKNSEPIKTSTSLCEPYSPVKPVQEEIGHRVKELDELDLAFVKSLVSYFEAMPDKIRHYHRDHHASLEEAEVIAGFYLKIASFVRTVKTQNDLEQLLKSVEALKEKVGRYQHESYKYRWSTGLEKEVLVKLIRIVDTLKN